MLTYKEVKTRYDWRIKVFNADNKLVGHIDRVHTYRDGKYQFDYRWFPKTQYGITYIKGIAQEMNSCDPDSLSHSIPQIKTYIETKLKGNH